jgi:hypothetical protein
LFPGAWIAFAVWALQQDDAIRTSAQPYAIYFCYGALAAAALISWYYDSMRLLAVSLALGSIIWFLQTFSSDAAMAHFAASLVIAFDFALFAAIRERGVFTVKGGAALALVVVQFIGMTFLIDRQRWFAQLPLWSIQTQRGVFAVTASSTDCFGRFGRACWARSPARPPTPRCFTAARPV